MNDDIQSTLQNGTFCTLSVSVWQASKKIATGDIEVGHGADDTLFRVNKDLIGRQHLIPIRRVAQQAGEVLRARSLPFQIRGVCYVPNTLIVDIAARVRHHESEFWGRVDDFCVNFAHYREEARLRLNGHYAENDYPRDIRAKFGWNLQMMAFSAPSQLRMVSPEMYHEAMTRFRQDIADFRENSVALLREKFGELVTHVVDRLTPDADGTRKIFRDSMIGNLRDFLGDFESLNITSDAQLQEQVGRVRHMMRDIDPGHLRGSTTLSASVADAMREVQHRVGEMIENAPRRRIRFQKEAAA